LKLIWTQWEYCEWQVRFSCDFVLIHRGLGIRIVWIPRHPLGVSLSKQMLSKLVPLPRSLPDLDTKAPRYPSFDTSYPNSDTQTLFVIWYPILRTSSNTKAPWYPIRIPRTQCKIALSVANNKVGTKNEY